MGGKPEFFDLGDLTGTGATTAIDVSHLENLGMMVGGTFVGTYEMQASFDGGATFVALPSGGGTAPKTIAVGIAVQQIRVECTAFTSGTLKNSAAGKDEDRKG